MRRLLGPGSHAPRKNFGREWYSSEAELSEKTKVPRIYCSSQRAARSRGKPRTHHRFSNFQFSVSIGFCSTWQGIYCTGLRSCIINRYFSVSSVSSLAARQRTNHTQACPKQTIALTTTPLPSISLEGHPVFSKDLSGLTGQPWVWPHEIRKR